MKINEIITEGVTDKLHMNDAMKLLGKYGATSFKSRSEDLDFYKNGRPYTVKLLWGDDGHRFVSLSDLNSVVRQLRGNSSQDGKSGAKDTLVTLKNNEIGEARKRKKAKSKKRQSSPNRSPVPRFYGAWGFGGSENEGGGGGE